MSVRSLTSRSENVYIMLYDSDYENIKWIQCFICGSNTAHHH